MLRTDRIFFNFLGMFTDPEAESGLYLAISNLEEDRLSNIQPLPNRSYCSIPIRRVSLDLMRN